MNKVLIDANKVVVWSPVEDNIPFEMKCLVCDQIGKLDVWVNGKGWLRFRRGLPFNVKEHKDVLHHAESCGMNELLNENGDFINA
jgi:hypothetical protein